MTPTIVEVAIPVPLRTVFHYTATADQASTLKAGMRVEVPFGRRAVVGYALGTTTRSPEGLTLRAIKRIIDEDQPTFDSEMLAFLRWMATYYHAPLGETLRGAHPAGTNMKSVPGVRIGAAPLLAEAAAETDQNLSSVLYALRDAEGPVPVRELPAAPSDAELRAWVDQGFIERAPVRVKARVDVRRVRGYRAVAPAPAEPRGRAGKHLKRDEIHHWLVGRGVVVTADIKEVFPNPSAHLRQLVDEGNVVTEDVEVFRDPFLGAKVPTDRPPQLTTHQSQAIARVLGADGYQGFLLHGITGSGKTEVYLHIIAEVLKRGEGALVLIPEIALTPQLVHRFRARLGDRIAVLHSGLSDGARYDQWRRIKRGELSVVIGARSGIFAPLPKLGVIVIDEEHDPSFKQGEGVRYNARDMALVRGARARIPVVLGSATPSLESAYNVQQGKLIRLSLPTRPTGGTLPPVELIDLRSTTAPSDQQRYLSRPVREAITQTLERGEQVIVFLNRRGFSSFVQCTGCGEPLECHQCAISMTWHKRRRMLHCHYCNAVRPLPKRCPACDEPALELLGRGTEKIEERLAALFPSARVRRLDRDTSGGKGLETVLKGMREREIDILIGTQMVTKGHDFPYVTLVCVLDADAGLRFPDFRAAERTIQLLTQVAGRAGRGNRPGRVLVQSWDPEQSSLQTLRNHDHAQFSQNELQSRRAMNYPPFSHAAVIRVDGRNAAHVERAMQIFAGELKAAAATMSGVQLRGPSPAALERIRNRTRWALLITAKERAELRILLNALSLEDKDRPSDLRVTVDVDPYDLL